jgi:hypothetical protein
MAGRRPVAANRRPHPVAQMKPAPHNDPPAAPDGLVPTGWEPTVAPSTDPSAALDDPSRAPFANLGLTLAELVTGEPPVEAEPAGNASGAFPDVDIQTDDESTVDMDMEGLTPGEAVIMTELIQHRDALANLAERQDWMINSIGQALGQFQQLFASGNPLKMLGAMMKAGKNGG